MGVRPTMGKKTTLNFLAYADHVVRCPRMSERSVLGVLLVGAVGLAWVLNNPTTVPVPANAAVEPAAVEQGVPVQAAPITEEPQSLSRILAVDPRVQELEQEVQRLHNELAALRAAHTPEQFLGTSLNVSHNELAQVLDRSSLVRSPLELSELMRVLPPPDVWAVLNMERGFQKRWADVINKGPGQDALYRDRKLYHETVVTPWVHHNLPLFLSELHMKYVPVEMVERFRIRQLENL